MDNLWQIGAEFRGQSNMTDDRKWFAVTSKLAEMTRTNRDRMTTFHYSKNLVEAKSWEELGFQEDGEIERVNLALVNLDMEMNDASIMGSFTNDVYNYNTSYQNNKLNIYNNFKLNTAFNKYANINISKDVGNNNTMTNNSNNINNGNDDNVAVKRFKTLPSTEMLPRNEVLGGYIFVCNNGTMQKDLRRQLFGLPPRYRDSVRAITPGLPLFLYNYTTHQLHGIFEAASFGGSNIDPTYSEDKKCKGESMFPAQVRIRVRELCKPLEEDAFRPVLHHYDGPRFRLELSIAETLSLLDLCGEEDM